VRAKERWRPVFLVLLTAFALPAVLNLWTSAEPESWKRYWPYFGIAALAMLLVLMANESRKSAPVPIGTAADRLARSVREQWRAEAEARRINDPVRLRVPLEVVREEPFGSWRGLAGWEMPALAPHLPGGLSVSAFAAVPRLRLVVLGEPGAGKTALLVDLVLELLGRQDREAGWAHRPLADKIVPVLFPLSSWDPERDLAVWLVEHLEAEHLGLQAAEGDGREAKSLARALVERGLILPVLDGFDEIPWPKRLAALRKISAALRYDTRMGIVVSSRRREFDEAAQMASGDLDITPGAMAVRLGNVTASDVRGYLGSQGSRWESVFAMLGTDSPVGRVMRTPLMISLANAVYNERTDFSAAADQSGDLPSPAELLDFAKDEKLREHLFDAFVPAAYRNQPARAARSLRWLSYLAGYLEAGHDPPSPMAGADVDAARTDLRWWTLREGVPGGVIGLAIGLPAAVAVGLVAAITPRLGSGLGLGIITSFAVGAAAALARGRRWRLAGSPDRVSVGMAGGFVGSLLGAVPVALVLWRAGVTAAPTSRLIGALGVGIGVGVCSGLRRGVPAAAAGGAVLVLTAGRWPGIPAGIIDGAGAWIAAAVTIETVGLRSPSRGIRRMGWSKAGYIIGATVGIIIGGVVAWSAGLASGLASGLVAALFGGLAAGLEGRPANMAKTEAAASPGRLLARDRETCWLVAILGGAAFGLGAGLGVRVGVGLAAGLTVGLVAASIQASWLPFAIARWWFAATGRLPLRLMSCLADAHRRGVLRQAGGAYQFRHAELQQRLATRHQDQATTSAAASETPLRRIS
jgi:hypothetical protein